MVMNLLQLLCGLVVLIGLAYVYTTLYGGPFVPFFNWLQHYVPGEIHLRIGPQPLGQ